MDNNIELKYADNTIVKIPVTIEEEEIAKDNTDNMNNTVKLKRYYNNTKGLRFLYLFKNILFLWDTNVTDKVRKFYMPSTIGKWYKTYFRLVIGNYAIGLYFMDHGEFEWGFNELMKEDGLDG